MRKIMIIITLLVFISGFSQEESQLIHGQESSAEIKIDLRINQLKFKIEKHILNIRYPVSTIFIARADRVELYEGMVTPIWRNVIFIPSIGAEYLYKEKEFRLRLRASLRLNLKRVWIRINYGSDWEYHDITTYFRYGFVGDRLQIGVASVNENLGPLLYVKIKISGKNIWTHVSYIDSKVRFRIKVNIQEWKWINEINPLKKNKR